MVRNYKKGICHHLDDYFEIVEHRQFPVCKLQIKFVDYVKRILKRDDVVIDTEVIDSCIDLIEQYRPFKLAPVQRCLHALVNGVFYTSGDIVFTKILLYVPRGFGKTSWLAEEAFYNTSNKHGIRNYNMGVIANSEDQSKLTFDDFYDLIDCNAKLQPAYDYNKVRIKFIRTNSEFKYYTSNPRSKDGLKLGACAFDEIHEDENYDKVKVFTSALGKIEHAREYYTTTDGYVREGPLDDIKKEALDVLDGLDTDIGFLPFMCCIDEYDQWDKEEGWIMANPMLPYLPTLMKEYRKYYKSSLKNSQLKLEFLTKRLNFPMQDQTTTPATHDELVQASQELPDLTRMECIGGIDYADTSDFIGVGLLFRKGDMRYWLHHTFIMEESLRVTAFNQDLLRKGKEKGCYTILPGKVAQEAEVAQWFANMSRKYRIKTVYGDDFRIQILKEAFAKKGVPLERVRNGWVTHNKVAPLVTQLFGHGHIRWGDDPFMRWYTNNVKIVTDQKGNKTYHKIEPIKRKTDGFMAMIHALSQEQELPATVLSYKPRKSYSY